MTFSNASVSACEVDEVAATAAGAGGLRAAGGGKAACWRVAGAMAGAAAAGEIFLAVVFAAGAVFLAVVLGKTALGKTALGKTALGKTALGKAVSGKAVSGKAVLGEAVSGGEALGTVLGEAALDKAVLGTALRAIGRDGGSGTFGVAQAFAANADNPTLSASVSSEPVPKAVHRNVGGGPNGVTAFLRGESFNR
jgi:hypothetical protein